MKFRSRRVAWLLAASALATFPASASGAYDPIGSGTATIRLDARFLSFLRHSRIKLKPVAPARFSHGRLSMPIVEGTVDPTLGKAKTGTDGAFALESGRNRVPFRDLMFKTAKSPLTARVGGGQFKVGSAAGFGFTRKGFASVFSADRLRLSAKVAVRLNKKLRPLQPFVAGQVIGSTVAKVNPSTLAVLERGASSLEFNPGFSGKLNDLFVSVNPIFPAERRDGPFTFPLIGGGTLSPVGSSGVVKTGGDLEFLQLHSNAQIFMHESWLDFAAHSKSDEVDIEPSPPFGGKLNRVPVFDLVVGPVSAIASRRTIAASAQLLMRPETAKAFNDAFAEGKEPFEAGEVVASISFTAYAQ